jgi:hypothetical protein
VLNWNYLGDGTRLRTSTFYHLTLGNLFGLYRVLVHYTDEPKYWGVLFPLPV